MRIRVDDGRGGSDSIDVTITLTDVDEPPPAPAAPSVSATADRLDVGWSAPSTTGRPPVTGYDLQYRKTGGAWTDWPHSDVNTAATITGVEANTEHEVRVRAINDEGTGPWSAPGVGRTGNRAPAFNRAPVFDSASTTRKVAENSPAGTPVGERVAAADDDGDALTYSLAGDDASAFDIMADSGQIRTRQGVTYDYETRSRYAVTVRADDGRGGTAAIEVAIALTDVNEAACAGGRPGGDARGHGGPGGGARQPTATSKVAAWTLAAVSDPTHGTALIESDGAVTYTPGADYTGTDRFTYTVRDAGGLTATASVELSVMPVNDAPEAVGAIPDQTLEAGGEAVTLDLTPYFRDADGDPLAYAAVLSGAAATVAVEGVAAAAAPGDARRGDGDGHGARPGRTDGHANVRGGGDRPAGPFGAPGYAGGHGPQLPGERAADAAAADGGGTAGDRPSHRFGATRAARPRRGGRRGAGGGAAVTAWGWGPADRKARRATGRLPPRCAAGRRRGQRGRRDGRRAPPGCRGHSAAAAPALSGTRFLLGLGGGGDGPSSGGHWTVWGQGDLQTFRGARSADSGYDGDVRAGWMGVDRRLGERWLAGLAVTRSGAAGAWHSGTAAGRLTTTLTAVHPYVRWSDGATTLWTMLGAGRGTAANAQPEHGSRDTSPLGLGLGLVEARRRLAVVGDGVELGLRGDAAWARLRTGDGDEALDALSVAVRQARVGVEAAWAVRTGAGLTLAPFGELSVRRDGGAGQTGTGLELTGGMRAARGLVQVEAQGRMLALHTAAGYEERGASVTLSVGRGRRQTGLTLSLEPQWGASPGGADALWRDELYGHAGRHAGRDGGGAVNARAEYGLRLPGGRLLTPFGVYGRSLYGRRVRVGALLGESGPRAGRVVAGRAVGRALRPPRPRRGPPGQPARPRRLRRRRAAHPRRGAGRSNGSHRNRGFTVN